ncbi:MAG: ABC-2 family transporter protein [Clostridiales bacterium]|nr:ABC-2 family transporter protein [Clostridiales bacterium]
MRKYFEIAKILFKAQLVYRFDVFFNALFTVAKIVFAYIVWGVIFESNTTVAGFTLSTMLSYYVISSFLSQIEMSDGITGEISGRIRDGSFSKFMVIPSNTFLHFLWQNIGSTLFYMIFNFFAAVIWIFIFKIDFALTTDIAIIFSSLLLISLGLFFMVQLSYFIGILTFKFKNVWLFNLIKGNIAAFVTGSLVPLVLLPMGVVDVMKFFPFYYVTYLPSMMLIGRNIDEFIVGIIVLSIYILVFIIINISTYNFLRKKYDGVGI